MPAAFASPVGVVAYLALFASVGGLLLFVSLLIGRLVRPADPHPEKLEIYECGEPTIGSSFVQFDLRFYVVALLFIIFDVEVALFFPWAAVFGKSTHLMDRDLQVVERREEKVLLADHAEHLYRELGVRSPAVVQQVPASLRTVVSSEAGPDAVAHAGARQLALLTIIDILVFFGVLLVGFAYVWKRGDLDWVRAVSRQRSPGESAAEEPVLTA